MENKNFIIIVADRDGFVGAFTDLDAAKAALQKYSKITPFIHMLWPIEQPTEPGTPIWVLPYSANCVVAYASTDKAAVEKVQADLLRLDLVPPDCVDYWESEIGVVTPTAQRRLDAILMKSDTIEEDKETVDRFLEFAAYGTMSFDKKINILEFVEPCPI